MRQHLPQWSVCLCIQQRSGWRNAHLLHLRCQASDVPATRDWNADGKTEAGIFRRGAVYLASSNTPGGGAVTAFTYGMAGDEPVAGKWT
ncbi:MAG: hypothetical protein Q7V05_00610 [Methanoregula sp.]|nr:hypothetical protein [Methanoregula sp.]